MEEAKITIGQAIDQIINALSQLDEKTREIAVNVACTQLGIDLVIKSDLTKGEVPYNGNLNKPEAGHPQKDAALIKDIRMLKEEKNPQNARQMACIVAYYLRDVVKGDERKDTISTADLTMYFKQANYPLPEQIKNVLPKSKIAGYFEEAGRGKYKLNAVGYNLVVHSLPEKSK